VVKQIDLYYDVIFLANSFNNGRAESSPLFIRLRIDVTYQTFEWNDFVESKVCSRA
jgi:hypothetical protein